LATVFVIGLSLEIAGAAFLAAELLTLDAAVLAARGNTYAQSGEPHLEAQVPAARTFVGLGLLLVGFGVQIGGYAFGEGPVWLLLLSVAVVVGGFLLGRRYLTEFSRRGFIVEPFGIAAIKRRAALRSRAPARRRERAYTSSQS